jgi:hypothetical protein
LLLEREVVDDGKLWHYELYADRAEARTAAGLTDSLSG